MGSTGMKKILEVSEDFKDACWSTVSFQTFDSPKRPEEKKASPDMSPNQNKLNEESVRNADNVSGGQEVLYTFSG